MERWSKSETRNGLPYYINHWNEITQWDHPDLASAIQSLSSMDNIRYGAYRTAAKLRKMQKVLHMDVVDLRTVRMAFDLHGYSHHNDSVMDGVQLNNIICEMYHMTKLRGRSTLKVNRCADLHLNWLLNLFDMQRTGCIRVLPVKLGITVICAASITKKYRYFAELLADRAGNITRKMMTEFMHDINQITMMVGESSTFGQGVAASVDDCFASTLGASIIRDNFYQWLFSEPQSLVWLPTFHRFAAAETMKHEVKCSACKMYPMIGLRYQCLKCINFDLCQTCFFTLRSNKHHKRTHPMQEYCLSSTTKEDVKAFTKTLRNNLSKKHGQHVKKKYHCIEEKWDSDDCVSDEEDARFETHIRLAQMSERLEAVEAMQPPGSKRLSLTPSVKSIRPSVATATTDESRYEEKRELEDLIDELEKENDELIDDLERLGLGISASSASSDTDLEVMNEGGLHYGRMRLPDPPYGDRTVVNDQRNEVYARYEILQEHNNKLEEQLSNFRTTIINQRENNVGRTDQSIGSTHQSFNGSPLNQPSNQSSGFQASSGVKIETGERLPPYGQSHPALNTIPDHSSASWTVDAAMRPRFVMMSTDSHDGPPSNPPSGVGLDSMAASLNHQSTALGHQRMADLLLNAQTPPYYCGDFSTVSAKSSGGVIKGAAYQDSKEDVRSSRLHGANHMIKQMINGGSGPSLETVNGGSKSHMLRNQNGNIHPGNASMKAQHSSHLDYSCHVGFQTDQSQPYRFQTDQSHLSRYHTNKSKSASFPMNKSRAIESVLHLEHFLPNLEDESTIHFPTIAPSMMAFPAEEAELNNLIQRMTDAFPLHDSPISTKDEPDVPVVTMEEALQPRPQRSRGRRRGSGNLFSAANRIGEAMYSLVTRVSVEGAQG